MKFARLLSLFLVTALAVAACGKDDKSPEAVDVAGNVAENSLLALVPADTPYFGGNLEPLPDALVDSYLRRFEPALVSLQAELSKARAELESNPEELAGDTDARVAHALLQELDGKLNRAGLESLGFDLSPEQVIYGMSAFPVMRSSLSDPAALRATVQRVLDNAGIEAPQLEFQGQSYWRIIPETDHSDEPDFADDEESDADSTAAEGDLEKESEVAIYVAILPDHLALGLLPIASEDEVLPAFLALQKPADSLAAERWGEINQRFGYTAYGSGVFDLQKFVDDLLNPDSLAGRMLASHGHTLGTEITDQCRSELNSIIAHTPYFYTGVTELNETTAASQLVVETEAGIAGELVSLVSDVPVANVASTYLAELALGLKAGAVRDFLRSKAMAIIEQPYQCELLQDMNTHAQDAADQLNQPIPPMFNNLLGLRAAISRLSEQSAPESAEGLVTLHVTQPEMLIGMAQMLVPDIAELDLTVGAPPVQIPSDMIPFPGLVVYAAQAKTAIGLSVGEGQQQALPDFMNQEAKANGTFLSVNYNTGAYLDMAGQMTDGSSEEAGQAELGSFAETAKEVYKSMADRSDTRMKFTKDGLVIDSKMTFKNP